MTRGTNVELENLCVDYGSGEVIKKLSLTIEAGELHVLLGESGCGKTTLLRAIAGFERCATGTIRIAGEPVDDGSSWVAPERRSVGVVFQDYALFPHLDVLANVAFARRDRDDAKRLIELVGLSGYEHRSVAQLSGGEQQRVALARALAQNPRVLLLDEPFSNLNPHLRRDLRELTAKVLRAEGVTSVFVTHDREEAMDIADRISVIHNGKLLQSGNPGALYRQPESLEIARALGEANALAVESSTATSVQTVLGSLTLRSAAPEGATLALVRPEQIVASESGVIASVIRWQFLGPSCRVTLELDGVELIAVMPGRDEPKTDQIRVAVNGPVAFVRA